MPDDGAAGADDLEVGWRVFEDARLLWVWVSGSLNVQEPGAPGAAAVRRAFETVDPAGYSLCLDMRRATVRGDRSAERARRGASALADLDLSGMKMAVVSDERMARGARLRGIVMQVWVGVEMEAFTDVSQALDWLGVSDQVSPADLVPRD